MWQIKQTKCCRDLKFFWGGLLQCGLGCLCHDLRVHRLCKHMLFLTLQRSCFDSVPSVTSLFCRVRKQSFVLTPFSLDWNQKWPAPSLGQNYLRLNLTSTFFSHFTSFCGPTSLRFGSIMLSSFTLHCSVRPFSFNSSAMERGVKVLLDNICLSTVEEINDCQKVFKLNFFHTDDPCPLSKFQKPCSHFPRIRSISGKASLTFLEKKNTILKEFSLFRNGKRGKEKQCYCIKYRCCRTDTKQ